MFTASFTRLHVLKIKSTGKWKDVTVLISVLYGYGKQHFGVEQFVDQLNYKMTNTLAKAVSILQSICQATLADKLSAVS